MLKDRLKTLESKIKSLLEDWRAQKARLKSLEEVLIQKNDRIEELEILMASLEEDVTQAEKFTDDTLGTLNQENFNSQKEEKKEEEYTSDSFKNDEENQEKDSFESSYFQK